MRSRTTQPGAGRLLPDLVAGACLAVLPFAVFVQHHDHGWLRGETLVCAGLLGLVGLLLGLLAGLGGALVRAGVLALLGVYVLDVQLDAVEGLAAILLGSFAGIGLLSWWLGAQAARIAAVAAATMLVTTLVLSGSSPAWTEEGEVAPASAGDRPPLFIHLILDEQIGVEGIPVEFDPTGEAARRLRDFYTQRGFRVFGRAYTRFGNTFYSLANLLNLRTRGRTELSLTGSLGDLKYFDEMRRRGYEILVYQSDFLDLCHSRTTLQVDYCLTYTLERPQAMSSSGAPLLARAQLLTATYARLSFLLSQLPLASAEEDRAGTRTSSVSTFEVMGRIDQDLAHARAGQLWVIHLLLPHSPYAFDRECRLRSGAWLRNHAGSESEWVNDAESRAERYPLYLDQVECLHRRLAEWFDTLDSGGLLDDAIVVVHGDHGSRIALTFKQKLPWPESTYADSRSALFAFKAPGEAGGYDRRMLPLHRLFIRVVRGKEIPPGTGWAGKPRIILGDRAVTMHGFARPDLAAAE